MLKDLNMLGVFGDVYTACTECHDASSANTLVNLYSTTF